jgi:hypothetical protein
MTTVLKESMVKSVTPITAAWAYAALPAKMRKLPRDGPPYGTLDAGTQHIRSRFRAMDVIGEAFHRLLCHDVFFELLCGKLCGLKQASDFVDLR